MARQGYTDRGLQGILKEVEKLKSMCVKVGITDDVGSKTVDGGATIAKIAYWNEFGVLADKAKGLPVSEHGEPKWFIPPRPFIRGWADGKREQIDKTLNRLGKLVTGGKRTAEEAMKRLGEYGQGGVRSYIRNGTFEPNAKSTIARKGSSKPLIDNGTLRNSIRYQVINKPVDMVSEE